MSNKTILVVLGVMVVVVMMAVFASKDKGTKSQPPTMPEMTPEEVADKPKLASENKSIPQGTIAPQVKIEIDGKGDDWASVPNFNIVKPDRKGGQTYGCQAIKFARDDKNLYVLFMLELGIRERYDKQMQDRGRPTSGALGYLKFQTEDKQFSVWIPTGFNQKFDKSGKVKESMPTAGLTVSKFNPSTDKWDKIFKADSEDEAEFIHFEGKLLEIKLPLEKLGITGASPIIAGLNEM